MATQQRAVQPRFFAAGAAKLQAMREAGSDPTATPEAQRRRAVGVSKQRKVAIASRDDESLDATDFRRDILPMLQGFTVRAIADALGISQSHASKVRGGTTPPHKRHWQTLLQTNQRISRGEDLRRPAQKRSRSRTRIRFAGLVAQIHLKRDSLLKTERNHPLLYGDEIALQPLIQKNTAHTSRSRVF